MKGYSIITNFGCKNKCSYCIWNKNSLHGVQTDSSQINRIDEFVSNMDESVTKLSVSGGGDPLNEFNCHLDFWTTLTQELRKKNKKLDIHTSYIDYDHFPALLLNTKNVNRIVFHGNVLLPLEETFFYYRRKELLEILKFYYAGYKMRIVYVLDDSIVYESSLLEFEDFCRRFDIQIAYRELVTGNRFKNGCSSRVTDFCKNVSKRYELGRYVEQADYNVYLMPDGNVYDKFQI